MFVSGFAFGRKLIALCYWILLHKHLLLSVGIFLSSAPLLIGIVPICIMSYSYFSFIFLGGLWPLTTQAE